LGKPLSYLRSTFEEIQLVRIKGFSFKDSMAGWIKLHRKFQKWEWKDSPKHVAVFLDLLLEANRLPKHYRGEHILAGSLTTSLAKISSRTGVSIQSVRTILADLEATQEVTRSTNAKRTMISITNWEDYQLTNTVSNNETQPQVTNGQQLTRSSKKFKEEEKEAFSLFNEYTKNINTKFINIKGDADIKAMLEHFIETQGGINIIRELKPGELNNVYARLKKELH